VLLSFDGSDVRLSRSNAFLLHLALSLIVFSSLVAMMLLYWFPGKLFVFDGGWQGLKLVAMVDLVLGPALTLLLYKPGKPKLLLDMSLIAGIQLAALAYGFHTTYQQRTMALVFSEREFYTVSAKDHIRANEQLRRLEQSPTIIPNAKLLEIPHYVTATSSATEQHNFLEDYLNGYPGPQQRSDKYLELVEGHNEMQRYRITEEQLVQMHGWKPVNRVLKKYALTLSDVELYKFKARYAEGVAIFDPDKLRIINYVAIDPDSNKAKEPEMMAAKDAYPNTGR